MSINLITYWRPSFLCWSDACPEGMGGFDHSGHAWLFLIPTEFREAVKNRNNCLEFLASIVTIWQAILQGRTVQEECFLSLGDYSSSVGWLHKASIDPEKNLPLFLASRKFAQLMIIHQTCIYSQHISGVSNKITDILSRRFDLDDTALTSLLNSFPNLQVQNSFRIFPIHPEINSWMTYWLQKCSEMKELRKRRKVKKGEFTDDGSNTHIQLDCPMMSGCPGYTQSTVPMLSAPLQLPSDEENFLVQTKKAWLLQQSKRPWQNWVRSLGQTWGTTPHMDLEHTVYTHYLPDNSRGCVT